MLVRERQPGVPLERAAQGFLGRPAALSGVLDELADHAPRAAELRPRGREAGVELEAALVEVAREGKLLVLAGELVRAEVEGVGRRVVRPLRRGRVGRGAEGQGEGLDHAAGDLVLQSEEIAERGLDGVGREERPARRVDELRRGAQLVAGAHERAHHHAVDVGLGRERLQVGRVGGGEARGGGARADDERAEPRERGGDRVGEAEREEVGLGVRPQDAEGQDHEAGEGASQGRALLALHAPHAAQVGRHRVGGRRPPAGALRERAPHHAIDRGDGGGTRQGRGLLVERRVQDLDGVRAAEGGPSGQHLEEDRARREEIRARVERLAGDLLGRHVARRPEHDAGAGQLPRGARECRRALRVGARAREAEVEELHPVRREEDVRGLQVAVDDPALVQRLEGGEHPERDREGVGDAERAASQPLRRRLALEELHRDEELALVLADLVELAHVRVVDRGRGAGLPPEPPARRVVGAERRHLLQGDGAAEPLVPGGVDDAHPALAELPGHGVGADARGHAVGSGRVRRVRRLGRRRAPQPVRQRTEGAPGLLSRLVQ